MKVYQRMTTNVITVTPETTYRQVADIFRDNDIRRAPVLDKTGKMVGIITEADLNRNSPSEATALSIHEINTLLDKIQVKQIMSSPVYAIEKECGISAAARFMLEKDIECLPVMEGDKVIGIITETDIFKAFVEAVGGGIPGMRIDMLVPDRPGVLSDVAEAINQAGGNIVSITTFKDVDDSKGWFSIKEQGADQSKLEAALKKAPGVDETKLFISPANIDKLLVIAK